MNGRQLYLRSLHEQATRRQLEVAKLLRENPEATNIELADALNVDRDTIAKDRKALMEQIKTDTKSELELLREELRVKLEKLEGEVEKHRNKNGLLSLGAIDQQLCIIKAISELLGARKPVKEKLEIEGSPEPVYLIVQGFGKSYGGEGCDVQIKPGDKVLGVGDNRTIYHADGTTTHPDGVTAEGQVVIEQHHERTAEIIERDELLLTDGEQKIWDVEIEKKEPPAPSTEKTPWG